MSQCISVINKQENKRNKIKKTLWGFFKKMYLILVYSCVKMHLGHASLSLCLCLSLRISWYTYYWFGHIRWLSNHAPKFSRNLAVLLDQGYSKVQYHHPLGACSKYKFMGPSPDLDSESGDGARHPRWQALQWFGSMLLGTLY